MKFDKQELEKKIREAKDLSNEDKSILLGLLNEKKTYGLVWEDSTEDAFEQLKTQLPILREVKERQIVNDTETEHYPNHILIEGENLQALVALTYTHAGMIDVIYIDPPYNRGENDFIYNDRYIDKENPFKHSLWLSFMRKRLIIAKELLSPNGVIIVHIDEHEFDALHMLMENEIFSEECNLGVIIWNKMNPKGDAHSVAIMHEYILVFCKNKESYLESETNLMRDKPNAQKIIDKAKSLFNKIGTKGVPDEIKSILKSYNVHKDVMSLFEINYDFDTVVKEFQNWLKKSDFSKGEKAYKYIDKQGQVFRTVSMAWPNKDKAPDDYWIPLRHPLTNEICPLPSKGWRNPSKTMELLLGDESTVEYKDMVVKGEIAFTQKKNGACNIPERVYLLKDNMLENVSSIINDGSSSEQLFEDLGLNFPYPKCMNIAKYLLSNVIRSKELIILDFFAGSGTTMHATMQLNKEDGGHRKCILVTNNENGICENVTYERNKRVIEGYTKPNGEFVEGLKDNNLRYYKIDFKERKQSHQSNRELFHEMKDLLCIKEDIYQEQHQFGSLPLKGKERMIRYFAENGREMLMVYDTRVIPFIVKEIEKMSEKVLPLKIYIFADGAYPYTDDFATVIDKVSLVPMPYAFYRGIKDSLPDVEPKKDDNTELTDEEQKQMMAEAIEAENNEKKED